MSTDKHRIAAYIPSEVKEKFEAFKLERKVGDSKALVIILTEFLGVSYQVTHPPDLLNELKNELLSELKKEVAIIEQKLGELRSELPKPGKEVFSSSSTTGTEGILNIGEKSDKLENSVKVNTLIKISGELMAKRMGYANSKSLANLKKDEEFSAKTMLRDPDGIAWTYCREEGSRRMLYSPKGELKGNSKSKLLSWIEENTEQG
jgi:hypothetical protein